MGFPEESTAFFCEAVTETDSMKVFELANQITKLLEQQSTWFIECAYPLKFLFRNRGRIGDDLLREIAHELDLGRGRLKTK